MKNVAAFWFKGGSIVEATFWECFVPPEVIGALATAALFTSTPVIVSASAASAGAGIALTLAPPAETCIAAWGVKHRVVIPRDVAEDRLRLVITYPSENGVEAAMTTATQTLDLEPDSYDMHGLTLFCDVVQNRPLPILPLLRDAVAAPALAIRQVTLAYSLDVANEVASAELMCYGHAQYFSAAARIAAGALTFDEIFGGQGRVAPIGCDRDAVTAPRTTARREQAKGGMVQAIARALQ
jgi:hypothetical protein